ncbi:carbohydrate ABC transporter permease [Advenella mimigardefordensis]|uniref:ABC transporter permease protein n=1 Tax=Advenella mimigardefordensis (strain DSM 17166 / LMG 22922 / DPN7) TaxID=1247726 RepID=W0P9U8_ADVMD|nr:sugar ABC transporter permease [Advenella mimigardefordensis]AHG63511.1 ABC transporter permease protein [Advenella mimigardefordensis DPN7]
MKSPLPDNASGKSVSWEQARNRAFLSGLLPALAVLLVITLAPALALVVTSFTPLSLVDPEASFNFSDPLINFRQLMQDERFLGSVVTQCQLSVLTVAMQLVTGTGLALLLNGKSSILQYARSVFLIPMLIPPVVVALIWKIIYSPDISPMHRLFELSGWTIEALTTNPHTALLAIAVADTWQWFPFTLLMVLASLHMLPADPVEAAKMDGASRLQVLRYIVLPHIRPVLVVCGLFRLIDSFKAFPLIYILTDGGPGNVTEVSNYYGFTQAFNFSYWGYGSAIAVLILAGVFVLSLLVTRFPRSSHDTVKNT